MTSTQISDTVMRRVHAIHALRLFTLPVVALGALLAALWGIGKVVWVAKVFENMPALSDIPGVASFYIHAFLGTGILEQVLVLIAMGACALFFASFIRNTRAEFRFA